MPLTVERYSIIRRLRMVCQSRGADGLRPADRKCLKSGWNGMGNFAPPVHFLTKQPADGQWLPSDTWLRFHFGMITSTSEDPSGTH